MTQGSRGIRRFIPPLLFDAPDFRRLWLGQTISVFGDQITQLGLPLVAVLTLGADATQMGTLTAVGLLPHLLFSLLAGVWLDRVRERRRLMIAADLGRAALIASIPVAYALDALAMPQLYVVGFLAGTLSVIFDLSWNTLFVAVTKRDRYVEARRCSTAAGRSRRSRDRPIGGLMVQVLGAPLAMLGDAISYLGSVVFLRRIRAPEPPIEHEEGSTRDRLLAGLSFVVRDPIMRPTLLSVATVNMFTFASSALFILYATTTLGVSPGALGLALGVGSVGAVIGAIFASRIGRRIGLGPAYALGLLIFPTSLLLIPLADADMAMAVILALAPGLRVRRRLRRDDPRHQHRGDHLRPHPGPDPGPCRRGVPVHQLRRAADRGVVRRPARHRDRRA